MRTRLACCWIFPLLVIGLSCAGNCQAQNPPPPSDVAVFGTTVVIPAGLHGQIYFIRPSTKKLPKFEKLKPKGTVYTTKLNITPREFSQGFPGVTDRFEWFAIDYSGRFWIEMPGEYRFRLTSDDGSKLYVDDQTVVNNDGVHAPVAVEGKVKMSSGIHSIRVAYFQGPRFHVALVLAVAGPDQDWKIFDVDDFRPPADLDLSKESGQAERRRK